MYLLINVWRNAGSARELALHDRIYTALTKQEQAVDSTEPELQQLQRVKINVSRVITNNY